MFRTLVLCLAVVLFATVAAHADIYRWDNGEVIPGTEGIEPGPGVQLDHRELEYADLGELDLTNANFEASNLTHGRLGVSILQGAFFNDAIIAFVLLDCSTHLGFTKEQLYSTLSHKQRDLRGISFHVGIASCKDDLSGWDFAGQNLEDANFSGTSLFSADLSDAIIRGARIGLSEEQLYSTASYKLRDLRATSLSVGDGWNLRHQDLTGATFSSNVMRNVDLYGAKLTNARFASLTALTNTSFVGAELRNTDFNESDLAGADISYADARGAFVTTAGTRSHNTILPGGEVAGLALADGNQLVIRDDDGVPDPPPVFWVNPREPLAVAVQDSFSIANGGALLFAFEADPWDSLISFEPGIPVQLGGTLELTFAEDVDVATQVGRTLHIFDWTGVNPTGKFQVASPYPWDVSNLYATGEVTLLLPGDTNGDEIVDLNDLNNVRNNFGGTGTPILGDTNGDHLVNLEDLNAVRNNFGATGGAQAVPEPGGFALLAIGGLMVLANGRRNLLARVSRGEYHQARDALLDL